MTAKIIDGQKVAEKFLTDINKRIKENKGKPGLAIILVGKNPASEIYVNFKEKKAKEVGLYFEKHNLDEDVKQDNLLRLMEKFTMFPETMH